MTVHHRHHAVILSCPIIFYYLSLSLPSFLSLSLSVFSINLSHQNRQRSGKTKMRIGGSDEDDDACGSSLQNCFFPLYLTISLSLFLSPFSRLFSHSLSLSLITFSSTFLSLLFHCWTHFNHHTSLYCQTFLLLL